MKDKDIRNILISYIQSMTDEVRIYQEKAIGTAICDVMAVTDKLIGFEIKSDVDNYQRLDNQIKAYDRFFDKNYIVVSRKHIEYAEKKVPYHWGIIYIEDDGVYTKRKATKNPNVSRRSQLSVLWKLELKNLLISNHLPSFAQKEKGYISDQIVSRVPHELLGKQIAQELLNRDYSVYNAKDYSLHFKNEAIRTNLPINEIVDALSEGDFEQITLDKWIDLYKDAKEIKKQKETVAGKKVIVRTPHKITFENIEVSLGVPWIDVTIINDFINYIAFNDDIKRYRKFANYEPLTGAWHIDNKKWIRNARIENEFGTMRYNALWIIEATLNLREINLFSDGKFDEKETIAALEKQRILKDEFKAWVWRDEDRKWLIEEAYNKMFEQYKVKVYDGKKLDFPEMSKDYDLYDYQKDAVQRIISEKNTLLSFDVGAGKTYIMIASAMKMRQMGISNKNMFVVPNSIVGQWERIFTELYPTAKVLAIEPKLFKPEMRQKVLSQMKNGDYDGIIIAYSCFEMIPISSDFILSDMQEKINEINDAMQNLRKPGILMWGNAPLNREINRIKKHAGALVNGSKSTPDEITFDELEINTLYLDEAHNYKNIPISTSLKNLRGINTKGSLKCLEMMQKVRSVQKFNGGRGVVFATGTPLCNSISDAYTMQMYLQYDEMHERHFDIFDNWVKTFSNPETLCEIDVTASNFRMVTRFSKFFNLPELSMMFSGISIFHSMDGADGRPERTDCIDITIKQNKTLTEYMQRICERTEEIRSGKIDKSYDNMLKVSTDGRKAALDLSLVGEKQEYDETSKIVRCVDNVFDMYLKYPETSQLIFCDYSTPKSDKFNVYQEIKERLVQKGIADREIAFVHSFKTESTRLKMFEAVNSAKIKVMIGSTFKLGIGANVQTKLKAIHHLDVPWRPADMTQREGRILRKGNENNEIKIFRYVTEGSFDSYSWQILETKQKFISQFLKGSTYQRTAADLDNNVLSYAEVKALTLSNPVMKELAEKENELKTLQILRNEEVRTKELLKEKYAELSDKLKALELRTVKTEEILKYAETIDKKKLSDAIKMVKPHMEKLLLPTAQISGKIVTICGFEIVLPDKQYSDKPYFIIRHSGIDYSVDMSEKGSGNLRRIYNFIVKFQKVLDNESEKLEECRQKLAETEKALNLPEQYLEALTNCKKEIDILMVKAKKKSLVAN